MPKQRVTPHVYFYVRKRHSVRENVMAIVVGAQCRRKWRDVQLGSGCTALLPTSHKYQGRTIRALLYLSTSGKMRLGSPSVHASLTVLPLPLP